MRHREHRDDGDAGAGVEGAAGREGAAHDVTLRLARNSGAEGQRARAFLCFGRPRAHFAMLPMLALVGWKESPGGSVPDRSRLPGSPVLPIAPATTTEEDCAFVAVVGHPRLDRRNRKLRSGFCPAAG